MAKRLPKYSHHKATGQARVRISGRTYYLGKYDSPESHERYDSLISQYLGKRLDVDREQLTIARLALLFVAHARSYYLKDGIETSEVQCIQLALRPLVKQFGGEKVSQFGPRKLQRVRDEMIGLGWARTGINAAVQRITRMFRRGLRERTRRPGRLVESSRINEPRCTAV